MMAERPDGDDKADGNVRRHGNKHHAEKQGCVVKVIHFAPVNAEE